MEQFDFSWSFQSSKTLHTLSLLQVGHSVSWVVLLFWGVLVLVCILIAVDVAGGTYRPVKIDLLWIIAGRGRRDVGVGVAVTILELAIGISWRRLVDIESAILAGNDVAAGSWTDRLLDRSSHSDGESRLAHVHVDVGEDVDAAVLVDHINGTHLAATVVGHVLELIDDKLESTVAQSGVGGFDILVVWHEFVQNVLVGELVDLSRVGDESLVLEGCLVGESAAGVQEVADDSGIAHPPVDSELHQLTGSCVHSGSSRVASVCVAAGVGASVGAGVSSSVRISIAVGISVTIPVAASVGGTVTSTDGSVALFAVLVRLELISIAGTASLGSISTLVLRSSDCKSSQKESNGGKAKLHLG